MSAPPESFWQRLPLGKGVRLLTHDPNGVAAFEKPAGTLSHPNEGRETARALLNARYDFDAEAFAWKHEDGTPARLWLLNRLDSATSGAILAAADETVAQEIRAQFRRKLVRKIYHALVFGVPRQQKELWKDVLAVQKRGGTIRTSAGAGRVPAESSMTVVGSGKGGPKFALLRLEPHTGRSHQLRVQCARRQLPIVGDQTYGDFPRNREFAQRTGEKRLFLHSTETVFEYTFRGRTWTFAAQAPLPPEFEKFL